MGKHRFNVNMNLRKKKEAAGHIIFHQSINQFNSDSTAVHKSGQSATSVHSQVIHVAGVRHLLQVHTQRPLLPRVSLDDAVFHDVLQVRKAAPDITEIIHWISPRSGVPVPEPMDTRIDGEVFEGFSFSAKTTIIPLVTQHLCSPVFDFVGALHRVNVHADFELDVRRHVGAPREQVHKDEAGPELAFLQQVQGSIGDGVLVGQRHKFVQDHTLGGG